MAVRLTCLTIPYARDHLSRRRAYEGIKRAGYTHVGLYDRHDEGPLWPEPVTEATSRAAVQLALDAGLRVDHKSHGEVTGEAGSAAALIRAIGLAAAGGVPALVCWGPYAYPQGGFPDRPYPGPAWQAMVDGFSRSFEQGVQAAEAAGVLLLTKPHTGVGKHGRALRAIYERFHSRAVAVCYDTGNVHYYEGIDPVADVTHVASICRQLIVKDHVGGRGNPVFRTPGDGDIDHQAVLATLARAGFDGALVTERVDVAGAERIDRELQRARFHLAAIAAAVGLTTDA
ncbi:MAG: sugar phosphate isomerase/epimerase [Actinobacteria bacterium]|nr:sugar phosphate isomerase/epimerase [Actinomycetota bacterium]